MYLSSFTHNSHVLIQAPACKTKFITSHSFSTQRNINVFSSNLRNLVLSGCIGPTQELVSLAEDQSGSSSAFTESSQSDDDLMQIQEVLVPEKEAFSTESIWSQMVELVKFSGPAVGLWLCGPLMSLIDTAVVGQESSIELAALGPGTVLCDHTTYVFMFLSVATSNFVATALAKQDKGEVQRKISILMFLGLACGSLMLVLTRLFGLRALSSFTGGASKGEIIVAANTYVQIRALAWPAVLLGSVAQSASLGMKDSWGPLKALAVASAINGVGDIVLCRYFNYGIAGAAWATFVSQVVAGLMMVTTLNKKGYNGYALSIPSYDELTNIFMIAAPVFVTMMSKVLFYSLLVYFATSMGTHRIAAHQVMIQLYCMFAVWAEPLSQTAQSFMPELFYGANRSLPKARTLLKSLVMIGALSGLILGSLGTSVPWFFPKAFSSDHLVIQEMVQVLVPFFLALCVSPITLSLEGTLLAGRDLMFISFSMAAIFCLGSLLVLILTSRGCGLAGCWFTLAAFQWSRFLIALQRLTSPTGLLYSDDLTRYQLTKLSTA